MNEISSIASGSSCGYILWCVCCIFEWNDVLICEIWTTLGIEHRDATSKEKCGNYSFHGNWGIPSSLFFFLSHIPPISPALKMVYKSTPPIVCIHLHIELPYNRIKGTRLGEQNELHLRQCTCSFCSPLQIMDLNEQDGFQISSYVSPSRVFNFSLLRTCSPTNLCQALSISYPASLLLSFPFVHPSYWQAPMMHMPACWSRKVMHGEH